MKIAFLALVLVCGSSLAAELTPAEFFTSPKASLVKEPLKLFLAEETTFASHQPGMEDGDAFLRFQPGNKVTLTEIGIAVNSYPGTYSISSEGVISLKLKGYTKNWPSMVIFEVGKDQYLLPKSPVLKGSPLDRGETFPVWPFKLSKSR
jgi:hypothetical protein